MTIKLQRKNFTADEAKSYLSKVCTVTFTPSSSGNVIVANRDEDPRRSATGLSLYRSRQGQNFHIAREPKHGGTNMAIGVEGSTYVLLNGAFTPHPFGKSYRMSRGLVMLESLEAPDLKSFIKDFDFQGIEPFTLLRMASSIEEIRWDGGQIHYLEKDTSQPLIWASAQLYSKEAIGNRQLWYKALLKQNPSREDLLNFHLEGGDGDPHNDMVMNRKNMVRTVSVTMVAREGKIGVVEHVDLIHDKREHLVFQENQ